MKNGKSDPLRAWELVYDQERDALVMHFLDIDEMKEGYARIGTEFVPARKLSLTPEEAKAALIERIENGCRALEETRDRAIAGLKANRELLETAKGFPVLEAARAALEARTEPAIVIPGKRDLQ